MVRHSVKHLFYVNPYSSITIPSGGSEKLRNLPKITQLASERYLHLNFTLPHSQYLSRAVPMSVFQSGFHGAVLPRNILEKGLWWKKAWEALHLGFEESHCTLKC